MNININKSVRDSIIAIAILIAFMVAGWWIVKHDELNSKPSCPPLTISAPELQMPTFEGLGG